MRTSVLPGVNVKNEQKYIIVITCQIKTSMIVTVLCTVILITGRAMVIKFIK